jgi:glutamyl-tRNA synthetase
VVVDDWDMRISHVFRGDEHINNTPWQINLFTALGAPLPQFGHCPVILGDDGQKLSKRRGAVSVTAYQEAGYLPEAMLNYLARLGWSHGDEEIFSAEQMIAWFDGSHMSKSPAQWDPAKLLWVNAQHIKNANSGRLAALVLPLLAARGIAADERLADICALFKDRCDTLLILADWAQVIYAAPDKANEHYLADHAQHVATASPTVLAALQALSTRLQTCAWDKTGIAAAIKETLTEHSLKMPQLAMPLRVLVLGRAQTPAVDAALAICERARVLQCLQGAV